MLEIKVNRVERCTVIEGVIDSRPASSVGLQARPIAHCRDVTSTAMDTSCHSAVCLSVCLENTSLCFCYGMLEMDVGNRAIDIMLLN